MAGNFSQQEYVAGGFLSGIFTNPKVKKAIVDVNNYLASSVSVFDINTDIITEIMNRHELKSIDQIRNGLYDLYQLYFDYCYNDHKISENDRKELEYLKSTFCLERKKCNEKANELINIYIKRLFKDYLISPEQSNELRNMIEQFNTGYSIDGSTSEYIELYKRYWNLEHGIMDNISCDLILLTDEVCYFKAYAKLYELTTVTKKIKHKGHGIGFGILPGVGVGFSKGKSKVQTEDIMKLIESGSFYITNKRMVFKGGKKSNAFKLGDIVDVQIQPSGLMLVDSNGYNPTYRIEYNNKILELVVKHVITTYNESLPEESSIDSPSQNQSDNYLASPPPLTPAITNQLAPDEKKCPFCAEVIKAEAKLCRYCHSKLD